MPAEIVLLLTLSVIIWGAPYVAQIVRIPTPPIEIILGSLLAYVGLIGHHEYFDLIAEVGFLYLMFLAGMEVDLKQITNSSKMTIRKAVLFVLTLGALAFISGIVFNFNMIVTISLPLISVGLLASLSRSYSKEEEWLKLAFIVGVLGEIVSIATLTIIDAASSVGVGWKLVTKVSYLFLFVVAIYLLYRLLHLIFWWYPELKSILMPQSDIFNQDIRFAISLFFILISFMLVLELELALGAFIAGVAISAFFHHEKQLEEKMSSFGFGFLVPIFFVHVGASFQLKALAYPGVVTGALLITGVMIMMRIFAAFYFKKRSGAHDALMIAFALSMPLTLVIAVATIGYTTESIDLTTYYQLILASLFEIIISMIAIKLLHSKRSLHKRKKYIKERRVR